AQYAVPRWSVSSGCRFLLLRSEVRDSQIGVNCAAVADRVNPIPPPAIRFDGSNQGYFHMRTADVGGWLVAKNNPPSVVHALQIAIAVVVSLLIARLFRLPEAYWAPMSTLIVMQSTLNNALPISMQYFAGTAVGAAIGALTDNYFHGNVWAFGAAV